MLVKCDKCGQEYEVNESRIAVHGVRIKCPSCAHIFLVRRPGDDAQADGNLEEIASQGPEEITWRVRHIGLTYTFHDLDSLRDWLSGRNTLQDVKIARGEDDWCELGDYPEVMTTELITRFFPLGDVPTSNTTTAEEPAESAPANDLGSGFMSLDNMRSASTTGMAMVAPASVSADLSNAVKSASMKSTRQRKKTINKDNSAGEAPRTDRKKLIAVIILFAILAINIVGVTRFLKYGSIFAPDYPEYYDSDDDDLIDPTKLEDYAIQDPANGDAQTADPAPDQPQEPELSDEEKKKIAEEEALKAAEEEIKRQYEEAAQMVKARKWPEARATLEAILRQQPDNIDALQLLSKTYRGLELGSKAAEIDAQVKKLKAAAKNK